jgi:hypothetical protein
MSRKFSTISNLIGAGVIAASLAVVPLTLPAHAQNTAPDNNAGTTTQQNSGVDATGTKSQATERDHNDWGWLGLLGLIGLAGLAKKNRTDDVRHVNNDPNVGVRSGSDYR